MGKLITKKDISEAHGQGRKELSVPSDAIITPLAKDAAKAAGVKIVKGGAASSCSSASVDESSIEKIASMAIDNLGPNADEDTVVQIVKRVIEKM